jgi:hypothetical protein
MSLVRETGKMLSHFRDPDDRLPYISAEAVGGEGALALGLGQAVVLEHAKVVRNQRLGQSGGKDDVRNVLAVLGEDAKDLQPVRVGQDSEQAGDRFDGFLHINPH